MSASGDRSAAPTRGSVMRQTWSRLLPGPVLTAGLGLLGVAAVRLNPPERWGSWGWCPWLVVTGRPCPTCGGLRALSSLSRADLAGAWAANGYLTVTALLAVSAWLVWVGRLLGGPVAARETATAPGRRAGAGSRLVRWLPVAFAGWALGLLIFGAVRWSVSPNWFIG